jgi:hypothetical protein
MVGKNTSAPPDARAAANAARPAGEDSATAGGLRGRLNRVMRAAAAAESGVAAAAVARERRAVRAAVTA